MSQKNNKYDTFFEKGNGNQSATYEETIKYYKLLANDFPTIKVQETGMTDSGFPLHIVVFNPDKEFDFNKITTTKAVILINNSPYAKKHISNSIMQL